MFFGQTNAAQVDFSPVVPRERRSVEAQDKTHPDELHAITTPGNLSRHCRRGVRRLALHTRGKACDLVSARRKAHREQLEPRPDCRSGMLLASAVFADLPACPVV